MTGPDMTHKDYYIKNLSAQRLRRVYEIAPPRTRRYLEAEIDFIRRRIPGGGVVLDLGCGYGRVIENLRRGAGRVVGVDHAVDSLAQAAASHEQVRGVHFAAMDAGRLALRAGVFDVVACIQNGISAFKVDPLVLFQEALRVLKPGGRAFFSSYDPRFWEERIRWFRLQARHGLLGQIDEQATGDGVIACKDGFRATTMSARGFASLAQQCSVRARIHFVDQSSVFCEVPVS